MYSFDKEGGNPRPERYMQEFRDVMQECDLTDLRTRDTGLLGTGVRFGNVLNKLLRMIVGMSNLLMLC